MTKAKRNIALSAPDIGMDEWNALKKPIDTGWLVQGKYVAEFEKNFAKMHGVNYAVAVSSCSTALHLSMVALGISAGDEVIVPSFTWIATPNAVEYCGATPIFVDISLDTFNIDLAEVEKKITAKTKAIIPVHLFGLCSNVAAIKKKFPHLKIVEDAACASGSTINNLYAGNMGDIGCFSFHPRKSITCGDGGILTTNNKNIAEKLIALRNHGGTASAEMIAKGSKPYYMADFDMLGYNYRLTDLQAAMLVPQLKRLPKMIIDRNKLADKYDELFKNIDWIKVPKRNKNNIHSLQSYCILIDKKAPNSRNDLMDKLSKNGIGTRPGTHIPPLLGFYKDKYGLKNSEFPNAQIAYHQSIALPMHNKMSIGDVEYVVEMLLN